MDELKKWKNMYQKPVSNDLNIDNLIKRLNNAERNVKKRRLLLIICSIVLIITAFLRLSEFENKYYIYSYIFFGLAISMKLLILYKGKYNIINNESEFNNQSFIKNYIRKLKEKIIFKKKHLLIFLTLIIIGLNCALIGMYGKGTIFNLEFNESNRIYIHLFTFVIFFFGYSINLKKIDRYNDNILELIKELGNATKK